MPYVSRSHGVHVGTAGRCDLDEIARFLDECAAAGIPGDYEPAGGPLVARYDFPAFDQPAEAEPEPVVADPDAAATQQLQLRPDLRPVAAEIVEARNRLRDAATQLQV